MAPEVDIATAAHAKDLGNASYKKGKWVEAIGHYTTSSVLNPSDPAPLLNRSQAYLKLEKWSDAIRDCTSVLSLPGNEKNVKALFRRATGRKETGDVVGARADLERILLFEPSNSAAKEELETLPSLPTGSSKTSSTTILKAAPSTTESKAVSPLSSSSIKPTPIPIRIVDRFSPLPTSSSPTTSRIVSTNAIAGPSTPTTASTTDAPPQARTESFSSLKATRSTKKRHYAAVPPQPPSSTPDNPYEDEQNELRVPNSGLEWILDWERGDESSRWELLRTTSSSHLFSLLSPLLEPDLLASILHVLHLHAATSTSSSTIVDGDRTKHRIRTILSEMKNMPSFGMMRTMLSEEEKKWEREVETWCGGL